MFATLSNKALHQRVLNIALPMVLSNITVPLLGLVDTAVIGHLDHAWYLGGVALGNTIIMVLYFLLGFLRMSTTGLNAQSYGANDQVGQVRILLQGIIIASLLAAVILILHYPLIDVIFSYSDASTEVKHYAAQYYAIRVYGAPAALINMVIMGWLLGHQNAKLPMWILIFTNVINIILDVVLVLVLEQGVQGAAAASTIADYSALIASMLCVLFEWRRLQLPDIGPIVSKVFFDIGRFLDLNRDIFLRSFCLQLVFACMAFYGANLGDDIVAANAILMSLLMLISYGADGFAYAIEALVGEAVGAKNRQQLSDVVSVSFFWGLVLALLLTICFATAGTTLIRFISSIPSVQEAANVFMPWLVAFPLIATWCFLLDGVFIGATRAKVMRNSMFVSSITFFIVLYYFQGHGNHALWGAMLSFMLMRNITLGMALPKVWDKIA